jgi:hypothetical protein
MKIPAEFLDKTAPIHETVSTDVELQQMANILVSPATTFGTAQLPQWTKSTTTDISYIRDTQTICKKWPSSMIEHCRSLLATEQKDKTITQLLTEWRNVAKMNHDDFKDKYQYIPWGHFDFLNKNKTLLQFNSLYNILSPITTIVLPILFLMIPYIIIRFISKQSFTWEAYKTILLSQFTKHIFGSNSKKAIEFIQGGRDWSTFSYIIFTIGVYCLNIYKSFMSCIDFFIQTKYIANLMSRTREYLSSIYKTATHFTSLLATTTSATYDKYRAHLQEKMIVWKEHLDYILAPHTGFSAYSFTHIGNLMGDFFYYHNDPVCLQVLEDAADFAGTMDILSGLAYRHQHGQINAFNQTPKKQQTKLRDLFYVNFLGSTDWINDTHCVQKCITNNVLFTKQKGIIITGANASGKTTILKSTILSLIFSQQFGFGCYSPTTSIDRLYTQFYSYINIPDTSGRDSLFQAEARRCKTILDQIPISTDHHCFCVFDELYSGTNPVEATAAAMSFIEYLMKKLPVNFILTTHYHGLCDHLEKYSRRTNGIRNMNMEAFYQNDECDRIRFTYKLTSGISTVHGGILVLKDQEYPEEIITSALAYIRKSQSLQKKHKI